MAKKEEQVQLNEGMCLSKLLSHLPTVLSVISCYIHTLEKRYDRL